MSKKENKKPVDSAEKLIKKNYENMEKSFLSFRRIVFPIAMFLSFVLGIMIANSSSTRNTRIDKLKIQKDISTVINNGADLFVVKQVYKNRKIESPIFKNPLKKNMDYYTGEIVLSEILADIKTQIFFPDSSKKALLGPLNNIITEHSRVNPFDKLESSQKDMFEAIRSKLPDEYPIIQNDINKISEELKNKNLLVAKYLNKSTTSYWVSIIALFFSLVVGSLQIYQNYKKKYRYIGTDEDIMVRLASGDRSIVAS